MFSQRQLHRLPACELGLYLLVFLLHIRFDWRFRCSISSSVLNFFFSFLALNLTVKRQDKRMMSWRRVFKSVQALAAHSLLFFFTLLLVFKLDHVVSYSWWSVKFNFLFFPHLCMFNCGILYWIIIKWGWLWIEGFLRVLDLCK